MEKTLSLLLDWSFRKTATPHLMRFIYALFLALTALEVLLGVMMGFSRGIVAGVISLLLAPVVLFVVSCCLRIALELVVAVHRIANYLAEMARSGRGPGPVQPQEEERPAPTPADRTRVSAMGGGRTGF